MSASQPTILAIDSAVGISSVCVWAGGKMLSYKENRDSLRQAAQLVPLIEEALAEANIAYADLNFVAATVGPGSFTGIRIGLATARAIAFASGIACVGYTTLHVLHAAGGELCIINAGKGEVFWQHFGKTSTEPAIGKLEDILTQYPGAKIACTVPLPQGFSTEAQHPRADALAWLAANHPDHALPPSPYYIRPPDAKPQRSGC